MMKVFQRRDYHPDNVYFIDGNQDQEDEYEPVYIPQPNVNEHIVMGLNRAYDANPQNSYS